LAPLFDKPIGGFGELFRQLSYDDIGASTIQARAIAGLANGTLIFCLPGSTGLPAGSRADPRAPARYPYQALPLRPIDTGRTIRAAVIAAVPLALPFGARAMNG
jgi:hypothetical protein